MRPPLLYSNSMADFSHQQQIGPQQSPYYPIGTEQEGPRATSSPFVPQACSVKQETQTPPVHGIFGQPAVPSPMYAHWPPTPSFYWASQSWASAAPPPPPPPTTAPYPFVPDMAVWMKQKTPIPPWNTCTGKTRTREKYRMVYTEQQRMALEVAYSGSKYITTQQKLELSRLLGLSERQVKIWFQNRRAKERKQRQRDDVSKPETGSDPLPHPDPLPDSTVADGIFDKLQETADISSMMPQEGDLPLLDANLDLKVF